MSGQQTPNTHTELNRDVGRADTDPNTSNRGGLRVVNRFDASGSGFVGLGIVKSVTPHLYSAVVDIGGSDNAVEVVCCFGGVGASRFFGTSCTSMPTEGTQVAVLVPDPGIRIGYILCSLPYSDRTAHQPKQPVFSDAEAMEPGCSHETEKAWGLPPLDPNHVGTRNSCHGLPTDAVPGDWFAVNRFGVGVFVKQALASIKASDRARLDVSYVDDSVRLISGFFRHISELGDERIYNDGGYLTRLAEYCMHQCERQGFSNYGTPAFSETESDASHTALKPVKPDLAPKSRLRSYVGYLGDVVDVYVCNPDPKSDPETFDNKSKDQGLFGAHLDSSGSLSLRSAAGAVTQLTDKIPVPKVRTQPWDPEGDRMEDDDTPEHKQHFVFDPENEGGKHLEYREALMWENRQTYLRFMAQEKDYYLPEESELEAIADNYDVRGDADRKFSDNRDRRAYQGILEDGTILFRSSGGASLSLSSDGNIYIDCPGRVEVKPGGDFVAIAGAGISMRARKDVEVVAQGGDVRVRAAETAFVSAKKDVVAEGDQSVVLRSVNGTVYSRAAVVHMSARDMMLMDGKSGKADDAAEAPLIAAFKDCRITTEKGLVLSSSDKAGLFLNDNGFAVAGRSAIIAADKSLALISDKKLWLPAAQVDMSADPHQILVDVVEELYEDYQEDDNWMGAFGVGAVDGDDYVFHYSTTDEYKAAKARVYEPVWAPMERGQHFMLSDYSKQDWPETDPIEADRAEEDRSLPWPGHGAWDSAYNELGPEVNFSDIRKEVAEDRRNMGWYSPGFKEVSLDDMKAMEPVN